LNKSKAKGSKNTYQRLSSIMHKNKNINTEEWRSSQDMNKKKYKLITNIKKKKIIIK